MSICDQIPRGKLRADVLPCTCFLPTRSTRKSLRHIDHDCSCITPSVCLLVSELIHDTPTVRMTLASEWTVVSQDAPADFVSRLGLSGHVTYDCFACIQIEFDIILTVVSRCSHGKHVRLYIHDQPDINIISDPALALHLLSSYLPLVRWTLLLNCAASLGPMNLHH